MKEGKIYKNINTGVIFILTEYNPIFGQGIILYDPRNRNNTGKVKFISMFHERLEEFKGSLLITTI